MKITILADTGNQTLEEIVRFLNRAAGIERDHARVLKSGKRRAAEAEYAAQAIERLAETISQMEVVSSAELFATKLPKAE